MHHFGRKILFQKWNFTTVMNYRTTTEEDSLAHSDIASLLHM
jgi:hypothetical protein